jgi:superfamily II DNA or RNA helicase
VELRPYQREAVEAVWRYLRERDGNPCVVLPTAAGKSHVIARICQESVQRWNGRVLILAHVKELLEQIAEKIRAVAPNLPLGLYSAGLKQRDLGYAVTVAGIQSLYQRAADIGPVDLAIVDECHLIQPGEDEGRYGQFIRDARMINPQLRIIGTTATPFRMRSGPVCTPDGILNEICFETGVRELIVQGYLCPLRTKAGTIKPDTEKLHVRGGEYIAGEVEDLMDDNNLVFSACREIVEYTRDRKSVLIFASGVRHGQHICRMMAERHEVECGFVCGETLPFERAETLRRFRSGDLKYLCNVNVLTTGFDAPNIDCVAMVRPTLSPGLFYQMCLDMDTEVLTPSGWRRCHQVTTGDTVAAFDVDSETIEYVPALAKVHRPLRSEESMYGFQAPHLDIRLTNLHDLVVRSKSRSTLYWRLQPAQEASLRQDSYLIPVAGNGANHLADAPLSDAEIAFLGWFLTDGHHDHSNGTISIAQLVIKYTAEIRSVLDACGLGFREYPIRRTGRLARYQAGILFVIPHGKPRGVNDGKRGWAHLAAWIDKDVPTTYDALSVRQFRILLGAMDLANGRHPRGLPYARRTMSIAVGCRRRLADRIQQLAIERGFRCNIHEYTPAPNTWNKHPQRQWILHVREQRRACIGGQAAHPNTLIPRRCRLGPVPYQSNEWVWCLTTQHGTLVTRRNGKVAVVGNCGRGFRLHPGKTDCLILDYGGNVLRHGPVDQLRVTSTSSDGTGAAPVKECPQCHEIIVAGYAQYPQCGHVFPPPERHTHDGTATSEGILSDQVTRTEHEVTDVFYSLHMKRDAPPEAPRTMRVDYRIGFNQYVSEWICFEHEGYARRKAEQWWRQRSSEPVPHAADEATDLAEAGALARTLAVTVTHKPGEKFDRIVSYRLGDKPPRLESEDGLPEYAPVGDDDSIPF